MGARSLYERNMRTERTLAHTIKSRFYNVGLGRYYVNLWWRHRAQSSSLWKDWHRENEAVFIHVPKTAGMSLYEALQIPRHASSHCTAYGYRSADPSAWNQAYSFAFVRNPWDRFVSAYYYLRERPISEDDKKWGETMLADFASFDEFAAAMKDRKFRSTVFMWRHFSPQHYFVTDLSGRIIVNHIARFENLASEVELLSDRLGVPFQLGHKNAVRRAPYTELYDDDLRKIVSEAYAQDIDLFGYAFGE